MPHRGKMINDKLESIGGKYKALGERLQVKYGIVKEGAKREVNDFRQAIERLKKSMSGPN